MICILLTVCPRSGPPTPTPPPPLSRILASPPLTTPQRPDMATCHLLELEETVLRPFAYGVPTADAGAAQKALDRAAGAPLSTLAHLVLACTLTAAKANGIAIPRALVRSSRLAATSALYPPSPRGLTRPSYPPASALPPPPPPTSPRLAEGVP